MSRRKKKKGKKEKPAKFHKLQKALNEIYRLHEQNRNIQISEALFKNVDENLEALNENNFDAVGVLIVAYAELLFVNMDQHPRKWNHLDSKLEKLSFGQRITTFNGVWEEMIIPLLAKGKKFQHSFEKGYLYHYCFRYRLNQLIEDRLIPDADMIKALGLLNLPYVEERYLPRLIRAVLFMPNSSTLNSILGYYIGMKEEGKSALGITMQCALKLGRCNVVAYLLQKEINLPDSIDEVILTLMTAIVSDQMDLTDEIFKRFPAEVILKTAEQHHLFQVSRYCILSDRVEVTTIDDETIESMIELAAARYDMELLKKVFQELSEEKKTQVYKNHVWAYLFPDSLTLIQGEGFREDQAINIIRYYMEKGLFTFSLEEEANDPKLFGPKACGRLQMWIAYADGDPLACGSGVLREEVLIAPYQLNGATPLDHLILNEGVNKDDFFYGIDLKGKEYLVVCKEGENKYPLTTYYRGENERMTIVVFSHTPPKFFDSISRLINNLYQQISDKPFVLSNTVPKFFTSMDEKVGIMKNVARLIWLIAHGCFYYRDSKKAFNNISFALILCFGLKVCESTGGQSLNLALFNELALFIPSMECFVQEFPACFNVDYGGYPALLEKFSLAESEEKLFALEEEFGEFHKKVREELGIPETVLMKEKKNEGLPQTDMFRGKKQGENSAAQNLKGKEEESSVEFRTG